MADAGAIERHQRMSTWSSKSDCCGNNKWYDLGTDPDVAWHDADPATFPGVISFALGKVPDMEKFGSELLAASVGRLECQQQLVQIMTRCIAQVASYGFDSDDAPRNVATLLPMDEDHFKNACLTLVDFDNKDPGLGDEVSDDSDSDDDDDEENNELYGKVCAVLKKVTVVLKLQNHGAPIPARLRRRHSRLHHPVIVVNLAGAADSVRAKSLRHTEWVLDEESLANLRAAVDDVPHPKRLVRGGSLFRHIVLLGMLQALPPFPMGSVDDLDANDESVWIPSAWEEVRLVFLRLFRYDTPPSRGDLIGATWVSDFLCKSFATSVLVDSGEKSDVKVLARHRVFMTSAIMDSVDGTYHHKWTLDLRAHGAERSEYPSLWPRRLQDDMMDKWLACSAANDEGTGSQADQIMKSHVHAGASFKTAAMHEKFVVVPVDVRKVTIPEGAIRIVSAGKDLEPPEWAQLRLSEDGTLDIRIAGSVEEVENAAWEIFVNADDQPSGDSAELSVVFVRTHEDGKEYVKPPLDVAHPLVTTESKVMTWDDLGFQASKEDEFGVTVLEANNLEIKVQRKQHLPCMVHNLFVEADDAVNVRPSLAIQGCLRKLLANFVLHAI